MSFAKKVRVGVIRGGPSSEYEVSIKTGDTVLSNLPADKYDPIDIFIDRAGVWHMYGIPKKPFEILKLLDAAFVALHGSYGEDGGVQRELERLHVPFTGSKSLVSAIAMNKHLTKHTLKGVLTKAKMAFHKIFKRHEIEEKGIHLLFREIPHPSVIKPVASGSSVGVSLVKTFDELQPAIDLAFKEGDLIIIEEYIDGIEATCGVVDGFRGESIYALPPVEIIPEVNFFDYNAKYGGGTKEVCPANFDHATKLLIQEAAKEAHKALGLRHYSRSDFIVHPKRGVYFLETNTLPGLTTESLLPKSLYAVGSSMPEFLDHVVTLARK